MPRNLVSGMLQYGLYTRVIGRRILYFQLLSSTMDEAARLAREGTEEGTVVLAEEQTAARGRFKRTWVSEPGNLYLSIVLRPSTSALRYTSILSGVAVARAIRKSTGLKPTIKWPNDVRLRGKKVSGILVENSLEGNRVEHAIVGIGVNVALDPSAIPELAGTATSLDLEAGRAVDRESVLRLLLQEMDKLYLPLTKAEAGAPPSDANQTADGGDLGRMRQEWRGLLDTLGQQVEVRWRDEVYTGDAEDVDEAGNLLLRQGDGELVTVPAGEVTLARGTAGGR